VPAAAGRPLTWYVEICAGTPLLRTLGLFYLLPKLGLPLRRLVAAIAGLAINYSAYEAKICQGLQAVPASKWRRRRPWA
jgi:His/Glu/Gln/Arg/opine family amino acid ABC transporter permease subunit